MAQTTVIPNGDIVARNILLTGEVMRYLLNHPRAFDSLPDNFELVILPDDDPDVRLYNLDLLDKFGTEGKAVVFARIHGRRNSAAAQAAPSLFVPLAA